MDDQSPEMERLTIEMRETMRRWIERPDDEELKRRYRDLQMQYQRLFLSYRRSGDRKAS